MQKKSGPVRVHRARQDEGLDNNSPLPPISVLSKKLDAIRRLHWRKSGRGWRLYGEHGRKFGAVFPDKEVRGMWRTPLSGGRMSDMGNLSWARAAVIDAAIRDLEWEARHPAGAATPPIPEEIRGDFWSKSPLGSFEPKNDPDTGGSPP